MNYIVCKDNVSVLAHPDRTRLLTRVFDNVYANSNLRNAFDIMCFYDSIADIYEQVINPDLNRTVCLELLKLVLVDAGEMKQKKLVRVLDIGSGTGFSALVSSDFGVRIEIVGIDLSNSMLHKAHERGVVPVVSCASILPLKNSCFDAVIGSFSMHYLENIMELSISECYRVLKDKGKVAFNFLSEKHWQSMIRCFIQLNKVFGRTEEKTRCISEKNVVFLHATK